MTTSHFCSRVSQAEEGVFSGTAVRGEVYVLLPVEKRLWGDNELNTAWAAPAELQSIRQARKAGVTIRLYDPRGVSQAGQILVHASPSASVASRDVAAGLIEALAGKGWVSEAEAGPRLLICTQGTRDRCCAKWGFAVYREASRLWREDLFAFEPLEGSHLGGDRYAATGIFFPSGSMYGHLDHADLQILGRAEAGGHIYPDIYRGRVFESELTQVVRRGLARDGYGVGSTSPLEILNPQAAPGDLTVTADGTLFQVSLATIESDFYGSCAALARARISHSRRIVYAGAERV